MSVIFIVQSFTLGVVTYVAKCNICNYPYADPLSKHKQVLKLGYHGFHYFCKYSEGGGEDLVGGCRYTFTKLLKKFCESHKLNLSREHLFIFFKMNELLSNHCCADTYLLVCDAGGGDNPGGTDGSLLRHWGGPGYSPPVLIPQEQEASEMCSTSCSAGLFDPNAVGMLPTCMNPKERVKAK